MKQYTIGVDVGGTNVKLGLVNRSGAIVARSFLDAKKFSRSKTKLIDAIIGQARGLISRKKLSTKDILGIGLGLPGPVDSLRGVVTFLPNIPGWRNVPLKSIVQKKLRIPTFLDNDVNIITLGEWIYGAGRGYHNLMCMTLGTGVGGGLILNGALYRGEGFMAGELGHMPLNEKGPRCNCGGFACFERYVGNGPLQKKAAKVFKKKDIRFQDVFRLAKAGNKKAVRFWEETAVHIGNALVGVVNLLNLRLIVIGGGVSNNYRFLGRTISDVINRRAMKVQARMVKVVRAKLGDDAGLLGAQVLVKGAICERRKSITASKVIYY